MGKSPSQNLNEVIVNNKELSRIPKWKKRFNFFFICIIYLLFSFVIHAYTLFFRYKNDLLFGIVV